MADLRIWRQAVQHELVNDVSNSYQPQISDSII